jgi:hypothetical protein
MEFEYGVHARPRRIFRASGSRLARRRSGLSAELAGSQDNPPETRRPHRRRVDRQLQLGDAKRSNPRTTSPTPNSPTVWVSVERPAPVVGLQVGDYSARPYSARTGRRALRLRHDCASSGPHRRKADNTDQRRGERSDTSAGRSGPIPHSPSRTVARRVVRGRPRGATRALRSEVESEASWSNPDSHAASAPSRRGGAWRASPPRSAGFAPG